MKKFLGIVVLGLLTCNISFAETINYMGGTYEGGVANNVPQGQGILKTKKHTLEGSWYKGDLKKGELTWVKARTIPGLSFINSFDRYEGDFKNFLPHGNGTLWFTVPQHAHLTGKYKKGALIGTHKFFQLRLADKVHMSAKMKIKFKNNKVVKQGKIKLERRGEKEKREKIILWSLVGIFLLIASFALGKASKDRKLK